jgi:YTH domain-containing family protein
MLLQVIDVKLPSVTDMERSPKGETGSTELTGVGTDVLNKERLLGKAGEKNGEKGNDVAPQDLKTQTEKLAGLNGC